MLSGTTNELVVDASILFSFFKADSTRRYVFKKLLEHASKLISPDFVLDELLDNKDDIIKFAGINEEEFKEILSELNNDLDAYKEEEYNKFLSEANKISPHGDETKDDPYFALALSLNCAIWSDEAAFKEQNKVNVFNTKELSRLLEESKKDWEDKRGSESEGENLNSEDK